MWSDAKDLLKDVLHVATDQMHVHAGMAIFVVVAFLLRRRTGAPWYALACVALAEMVNEVFDARDWIRWTGTVNWQETFKDAAATLFWPTVLALLWRSFRFGRSRQR